MKNYQHESEATKVVSTKEVNMQMNTKRKTPAGLLRF